jgi:SOS-response transcriptional repressor LexA
MAQEIDDKWFRQKQKQAGITAEHIAARLGKDRSVVSRIYVGRQKMTLAEAEVFAAMLEQPLATVLEKAGVASVPTAQQLAQGFSDGDAAPWKPQGFDDRKPQTIAEAFGAKAGVDVWQVKGNAMRGAGLLPGDFILVDTHQAERVKPGDTVIAQVYARNGTAKSVLRRWLPPVLVSVSGSGEPTEVHVVDHDNVAIRGKVTAAWRLPN